MKADREPDQHEDDPMPPTPALGSAGPRPDWLVSAEDGVGAEASRMSGIARPPVIKPGEPLPPRVSSPPPPQASDASAAAAGSSGSAEARPASHAPPFVMSGPASMVPPTALFGSVAAPMQSPSAPSRSLAPASPFYPPDEGTPGAAAKPAAGNSSPPAPEVDDVPWLQPDMKAPRKEKRSGGPIVFTPSMLEPPEPPRPKPLMENPIVKGAAAAALLVILAVVGFQFVPKGDESEGHTRIRDIQKSPKAFDGRVVTVNGRVGEIFQIGSSWAYYLHDGEHTLLVFTRRAAPEAIKRHSVTGTISTGVLEGVERPSLFERSS